MCELEHLSVSASGVVLGGSTKDNGQTIPFLFFFGALQSVSMVGWGGLYWWWREGMLQVRLVFFKY
jgi:hypothetical protein